MHRVYSTTLLVLLTCCLGTLWPTRAATITGNLLHITGSAHPDKRITFAPVDTPRNLANGTILWTPRVVTSEDGAFSVILSAGHYRVSIDGITFAYRCIPDSEATYTFNDSEIQCHSGTGIFLSTNMLYKVLTSTNDLFPQYLYSSLEAGTNIVLIEKDDGTGTNKVVQINSSSSTRISTSQGNTSGDTITITNVSGVAGSTLWTNDLGVLRPLDLGESNPSETFKIYSWGGIGGGLGLGGIWYTPDEGDVFNAVHDASQGESEYAAFHFAAIDHQDATNYATFTTTLHSGTNASGVSTFRAAVDGSISEVTMQAQPYAGVARLEVKNMDETTFSVFDNAGTFVHNMLWAVDGFAMVPSLTTNLVAGVNELETMNKGVMLLTGPTTNPADTIVNLGDGNGVGNLFVLINNDQNSAFTLQDGDPLWDNPFAFHRLNGNWISTNRGDAIFLFNNGWFITEIGRISGNTNVSAPVVMNPTDLYLPYRQTEGVFADSPIHVPSVGSTNLIFNGSLYHGPDAFDYFGETSKILNVIRKPDEGGTGITGVQIYSQSTNSFGSFDVYVSTNDAWVSAGWNAGENFGRGARLQATPTEAAVVVDRLADGVAMLTMNDSGQIIFGPGTTNVLYRDGLNLIYQGPTVVGNTVSLGVKRDTSTAYFGVNSAGGAFVQSASNRAILDVGGVQSYWDGTNFLPDAANKNLGTAANPWRSLYLETGSPNGVFLRAGSGSPEGAVGASIGSLFARTDGSSGTTLYTKTSGTGNTGWEVVTGGGGGGTAGTVINTGASTVGAVPRYTDLTGTNIAPTSVTISGADLTGGVLQSTKAFRSYQGSLTHAGTVTLDFDATTTVNSLVLTGNVTFALSNLGTNRTYRLKISNPQATNCTVTLPSNTSTNFLGGAPTTITAGKVAMWSMEAWGAANADVISAWAETQ